MPLRYHSSHQAHELDYQYFVAEHSGHALQSDDDVYLKWLETLDDYLAKYMPL